MGQMFYYPLAERDMELIYRTIAEQGGVTVAERFMGKLYRRLESLASAPYTGRSRPELHEQIRSSAVAPYVIFFVPLMRGLWSCGSYTVRATWTHSALRNSTNPLTSM